MLIWKLAFKNILGQGFRSWLNFFILSTVFVGIIGLHGFYIGWERQSRRDMKDYEIGNGQYWVDTYDQFDPFTFDKSHRKIPNDIDAMIHKNQAVPILISTAVLYPEGRFQNTVIKGIPSNQSLLKLPSDKLANESEHYIPIIMGQTSAKSLKMKEGDIVTIRWRDVNGAFDANDAKLVHIFNSGVPTVDGGCIWLDIEQMSFMFGVEEEATIITMADENYKIEHNGWIKRDLSYLFADFDAIMESETVGAIIMYLVFIVLAMVAIFDTQMLAIFKRTKEIGTLMALGMQKMKIITLFITEGIIYAFGAVFVGLIYGIPLLILFAKSGWKLDGYEEAGMVGMNGTLYPVYPWWLYLITALIIITVTALVSWIPSRKISRLKPTEALRNKV